MYRLSKAISVGAQAGASMSWYSKTVVLTDKKETGTATAAAPFLLHDGEDHGSTDSAAVSGDSGDGGTGDREFNRYSARFFAAYRLMKSLQLGSAVGVSLVKRQFSAAQWNLDATIIQVTYSLP